MNSKRLTNRKNKLAIFAITGLVIALMCGACGNSASKKSKEPVLVTTYEELMECAKKEGQQVKLVTSEYYYAGFTDRKDGKDVAWYYFILLDDHSYYISVRSTQNLLDEPRGVAKTFTGIVHADPYRNDNLLAYVEMTHLIPDGKENDEAAIAEAMATAKDELLNIEVTDEIKK